MNAQVEPHLGSLCRRGHDHEGTGKSLRTKTGNCIECLKITDDAKKKVTYRATSISTIDLGDEQVPDCTLGHERNVGGRPEKLPPGPIGWRPKDGALTLEQVAQHLGLTRERVRQIEVKALAKLRRRFGRALIQHLLPTVDPQPRGPGR